MKVCIDVQRPRVLLNVLFWLVVKICATFPKRLKAARHNWKTPDMDTPRHTYIFEVHRAHATTEEVAQQIVESYQNNPGVEVTRTGATVTFTKREGT